jgi:predicted lipid-binding transport protein (Tim44 family)
MFSPRWLAAFVALIIALAPVLAEARAGAGSSSGSRGSRTYEAPPPTRTAPAPKPVERSLAPQQSPTTATSAPAQSGGFFSRNPFLSGVFGGMLGAGIAGMLFGGGFSGVGLGSIGGMLGLMLQLMLIGGLLYLALSFFRKRALATAESGHAYRDSSPVPYSSRLPGGGVDQIGERVGGPDYTSPQNTRPLSVSESDFKAFEGLLDSVQLAYGESDIKKLRALVTPEMVSYFSEQLSANASRNVENKIEAVKLEQGDLAEAWTENSIDYATVAMRFSMLDVTRTIADGKLIAGDANSRVEATELWTFLRSDGGKWILSAIQQTA